MPLIIGAGGRPGGTTDGSAVRIAKAIKAKAIVNLTNIDYVYDHDPRKDTRNGRITRIAKPFKSLAWPEYLQLIPTKRKPGGNYPFDPVASRLAQKAGISVAIINGADLENFDNYLKGKEWKGTMIS